MDMVPCPLCGILKSFLELNKLFIKWVYVFQNTYFDIFLNLKCFYVYCMLYRMNMIYVVLVVNIIKLCITQAKQLQSGILHSKCRLYIGNIRFSKYN